MEKGYGPNRIAGALVTDLSRAFDCLDYELLIAKLEEYGFDKQFRPYVLIYQTENTELKLIILSDKSDIASYAGDTTPYTIET